MTGAPGNRAAPEIDALDVAIICELKREARISNKDLSARVGLSPSACLARVRRLENNGVIQGYTALVSAKRLDLHFEAWVMLSLEPKTPEMMARIEQELAELEGVEGAVEVSAGFDVLFLVRAHSADEWRATQERLQTAIAGVSFRLAVIVKSLDRPRRGRQAFPD